MWNRRLFLGGEIKQEAIDSKADIKNVILSQAAAANANNSIQYNRGKIWNHFASTHFISFHF